MLMAHNPRDQLREFTISNFEARHLPPLPACPGNQPSGLLKRLRTHGLIKKIGNRYK